MNIKVALVTGAGLAGYFVGRRLKQKRTSLGCSSLRGLGPCRSSQRGLGQAQHTQFSMLMRIMGKSIANRDCGWARRALLQATSRARTSKEKQSLLKAYRKLAKCESSEVD